MAITTEPYGFGCKACFPPDADKAWEAVMLLKIDYELVPRHINFECFKL